MLRVRYQLAHMIALISYKRSPNPSNLEKLEYAMAESLDEKIIKPDQGAKGNSQCANPKGQLPTLPIEVHRIIFQYAGYIPTLREDATLRKVDYNWVYGDQRPFYHQVRVE